MKPRYPALALLVVSLFFAGCSDKDDSSQPSKEAATVEPLGDVDAAFLMGMIVHHEQAIEMSKAAGSKAASPAVKALAARIIEDQKAEIAMMTDAVAKRYEGPERAGDHASGHMSGDEPNDSRHGGMLSADEMAALLDAEGEEFDRLFLEGMIAHHQGAIDSAEALLENGSDPDSKHLARSIIKAQKAEIQEMKALLEAAK